MWRAAALALCAALALGACGGRHRAGPVAGARSGCGHHAPLPAGSRGRIVLAIAPALANGARARTAVIHVPRGYRPDRATPLVLEFHGAGPRVSAAAYQRGSPLAALADRESFIDVAPQGLRYRNGNLGWNAYGPQQFPVAELPFVSALIARVRRDYCVDARRIYASGTSNGANMLNYLACRATGRLIAAIAPVVGPMYGQDDGPCAPPRPMPILDVHSVNDPAFPYTGIAPGPGVFKLPSVPAWLSGWAALDHCASATGPRPVATGETLQRFTRCSGGAEIVAYVTHAGHAWPARLGSGDAAIVVWDFFLAHPL